MDWLQAIVLGLVEGVTEYLPVSSTGHLILAQRAMGIPEGEAADAYAICIQAGAILAVLLLYRGRVRQVLGGVVGRDRAGRALLVNLLAAFAPAAVVGLVAERGIKDLLFNLPSIAAAWVAGGLAILAIDAVWRRRGPGPARPLEGLGWRQALVIGLFQVLAMWPGTSRSLVTILGGLVVGLSLSAAVEFSFLLGVLTLSAATAKDALESGRMMLETYGAAAILAGFVAATLSAAAAVRWMVAWLEGHGLALFGWYRIGAGLLLSALLVAGVMGCAGDSAGGAVLDPDLADASDAGDAEGDTPAGPGPRMSCLHSEAPVVAGCSSFQDLTGQGRDALSFAEALCRANGGAWQEGECPSSGATGRCEQPGKPGVFLQTDWCYGDRDVCRGTCLGLFIAL